MVYILKISYATCQKLDNLPSPTGKFVAQHNCMKKLTWALGYHNAILQSSSGSSVTVCKANSVRKKCHCYNKTLLLR